MSLVKFDKYDDAWLGLTEEDYAEPFTSPLLPTKDEVLDSIAGGIEINALRNPEYFGYTAHLLIGIDLYPFQQVILEELWRRPFPMLIGARGMSKTFLLGLYALMRLIFCPGYKVVVAGAGYRQSRLIFDYSARLYNDSPMLKSLLGKKLKFSQTVDRLIMRFNGGEIIAIPIGTGEKVRGIRANSTICDEFASHDPQVVEEVLFGFGSVNLNPVEVARATAKRERMMQDGITVSDAPLSTTNQCIVSGTADFHFNHFYAYYQRYKKIILSKGDPAMLREEFPDKDVSDIDWRDYSIMRIPYEFLPRGFMSDKTVARARAQMSVALYNKEYGAIFVEDTDGFFRRSLIEGCISSSRNIAQPGWCHTRCPSPFDPLEVGHPSRRYVYGIDPASENDNLAICILEQHDDHSRLVHMWTTNREKFKQARSGIKDYYHYVVRKIRDLMRVFPCERLAIDVMGGGYALMEGLHNTLYLEDDEQCIWSVEGKLAEEHLGKEGLHLIEEVIFANYEWLSNANYDLRKDMEARTLLFPQFDPASIELALVQDKRRRRADFGMAELVEEIEELKNELSSVVHTRSSTSIQSREKWVVPVTVGEGDQQSTMKDRYTALLIANAAARKLREAAKNTGKYWQGGGLVGQIEKPKEGTALYSGPDWFVKGMRDLFRV